MTRRGLTILETLLALALLAGLSAAAVSWTVGLQRSGHALATMTRWESAAQAALDCLHDDLLSFDRIDGAPPPLTIGSGEVSFNARDGGPAAMMYRLSTDGQLFRRRGSDDPRLLVADVAEFSAKPISIDETINAPPYALLVTITSSTTHRSRVIPLDDRGVLP
ncbi:MAG: hypothetical protein AAGI53_11730 [Planctomycetota bacterium]